jgi:type IV pilus assembly protein PilA
MVVVVIIGLLAALAIPAFQKVRVASQDKAVLNNMRLLAAAADQYFTEKGTNTVQFTVLVGSTGYIKSFTVVAGESYPANYTAAAPIIVSGIAGVRVITYSN